MKYPVCLIEIYLMELCCAIYSDDFSRKGGDSLFIFVFPYLEILLYGLLSALGNQAENFYSNVHIR